MVVFIFEYFPTTMLSQINPIDRYKTTSRVKMMYEVGKLQNIIPKCICQD